MGVIERVATVLVIACPHALGLAVPLVVAITTAMGARNGILVRDRRALESARLINTVMFDKTGTLTKGEFGVVGVATAEGWDEARALALAAAIEGDSEHLMAQAIRKAAADRQLQFGPEGYLYIGVGDGGSEGDPNGNGQSLQTLLGKILRIDVDHTQPYAIPPENPYASGGGLWEIWAFGLRNPWRFSFDQLTGDLYLGDVGQDTWEEIDYLPAGSRFFSDLPPASGRPVFR